MEIKKLGMFLGGQKDSAWENGFLAGQKGDECPADASESFQDGYGRGYAAAEMSAHNNNWFKERGLMK